MYLLLNSWGIRWGLPLKARKNLLPNLNDINFLLKEENSLTDKSNSLVRHISSDENLARITRRFLLYTNHPDEMLTIMAIARMNPSEMDFNPKFFQYGGAFIYPAAAVFKIGSILGYVNLSKGLEHFLNHPEEISKFYILGRCLVIISCLFSVIAVYRISSFLDNKRTGLLSALILTILPTTIIWSLTFKPHMYGILFSLISLYFALKILESKQLRNYIGAGVFAGLAASTVINYGFIIFSSLLAILLHSLRHENRIYIKGLVFLVCGFLVSFSIVNYYYFFSAQEALNEFRILSSMWHFNPVPSAWLNYLIAIKRIIGLPMFLLMIGGLSFSLFQSIFCKNKTQILLLTTACLYFLLISSLAGSDITDLGVLRFGLLFISVMSVIMAQFITYLLDKIKLKNLRILFIVCIVSVFFWTFAKTIVYDVNFFYDSTPTRSTRILAGKWINEHIPTGSSICLWHSPAPFNSPPFKFDNYKIVVGSSKNADYVVSSFEPEWNNNREDYILLKSFEPVTSVWGFKIINPFYFANHRVSIFIRKDLYPEAIIKRS
jgi:hypothetical protein